MNRSQRLLLMVLMVVFGGIGCNDNEHKIYYPNGKLLAVYGMAKGKRDGIQKSYYENGLLHEEYEMKGDSVTGRYKSYFPDGKIEFVCYKINGKIHGNSKSYYENGSIKAIVNSEFGVRNGKFKLYDSTGILLNDGFFKNDKQDSLIVSYYSSGKVKQKQFWKEDKQDGPFQSFFENGKIETEAIFHNDTNVYYKKYNESGTLIDEFRGFEIIPNLDTIDQGTPFEGKVKIYGPNVDEVLIKVAIIRNNCEVKELKEISIKGAEAEFSVMPNGIGEWVLDVQLVSRKNLLSQGEEMKKFWVIKKNEK